MGNSDKTQTEKTNDPNSSETKCPYQNSANSPRQNSSASSGQNSSASSVTDPRGTNSTQHTDKKAFTDFQATDEIVLKYDFTDSRKHTTYKAATMLHGLEFVERVIVVRRTKSNVRHHQVFWAYLSLSSTIDRENLDTFDLWNVTPTEVKPEDVLDNVEDDENDNSAPNNSPNQVSTQSTKKSSDTDVELNTIACIIGEQLEPVDFSSKSKVSIKVTSSLTNDDRAVTIDDVVYPVPNPEFG
ncbi:uncharacterized protein OCT59_002867 [Rhizophagus irregularis]|nr:hypothetical protein RirG_059930 [Rhizophagus irregularis DAOM 197198w]UZO11296.1 hypothetical protein OCT59_002867 [Rhizophagus irregularis]GBC36571.1 hypothetical protein GLOIN_2v1482524 [Rhizophagus irregularis DAOM 181602=DAOM 197198]CAG8481009.1 12512_t:CDS:1 [Rhizophagus irregularis]